MYQIKCDDYILYDPRDERLIVNNPKCKLEVNTVGEASFSVYANHPFYGHLKKLRSVFEIKQDNYVIFRGRMTEDSKDFNNIKVVDLEGAMAYFNDSVIPPFKFPEDFLENADYITASSSGNVVEFFMNWLIATHNSQVQDFQKFKLGNVTVSDPNNYITRSSEEYFSTWDILKSKLFDSTLGGYLCIRYESDGNYIDYLSDFTLTNTQRIKFGQNLLDLTEENNASETYSAVLPLGAKIKDSEGNQSNDRLTIEELPNGDLTDDIVKSGDVIYSKSACAAYGFILAPIKETTWDDVTEVSNLKSKAVEYLSSTGIMLKDTINIKAVDLSFSDDEIASFRIYRYVNVESVQHNHSARYKLTKLEIDILNPQNTQIQLGQTKKSLIDENNNKFQNANQKIENTTNDLKAYVANIEKGLVQKIEGIDGIYFYLKYSEFEDGHVMTDVPDDKTVYMGTCSTSSPTAPTDYKLYTWVKVKGTDGTNGTPGSNGEDGRTQYLHIKYSNDGETFTENDGETLGAWIGTLVDFNEADSTTFSDYTWKKFTEDVDDELTEIRNTIVEQNTTLTNTCEEIILGALSSYTETGDFESYKETIESQLQILSSQMNLRFTETIQQIEDVDGDLQEKYNTITKYFTFDINGLSIGQVDSPYKVVIDNDRYSMLVNNVEVLWIANGEVHTPEITITNKLTLFGYLIDEDGNGNVNCEYKGG